MMDENKVLELLIQNPRAEITFLADVLGENEETIEYDSNIRGRKLRKNWKMKKLFVDITLL